jgi:copper homeostasis protein
LAIISSKTDFNGAIFVAIPVSALLEICAYTPDAAIDALQAGAGRVELCSHPEFDGISPPESWFRKIPVQLHAKLAVMVRPRGGSFCMSVSELHQMEQEIIRLSTQQQAGALVFGMLAPDNQIDEAACRRLITAAQNLPCVFHRAFDLVPNPEKSLQTLIGLGFTRLLCGLPLPELISLKNQAAGRISIMPGGGIRAHNVHQYLQAGFTEIHSSARNSSILPDPQELHKIIIACQN